MFYFGELLLGKCEFSRIGGRMEQGGMAARAQVCVFSERAASVFAPFSIRVYRESNGPVAGLLGTRN